MTLPIDLHSPDQLSLLIMELTTYIGGVRDSSLRSKDAPLAAPMPSQLFKSLLEKNAIDPMDTGTLEALLQHLHSTLAKAPVMHLTLADLPTRTLKRKLTVWFRTQIHPDALLTFTGRHDIGGGMILRAGSHVYDFSFRRRILENKQRIVEIAGV